MLLYFDKKILCWSGICIEKFFNHIILKNRVWKSAMLHHFLIQCYLIPICDKTFRKYFNWFWKLRNLFFWFFNSQFTFIFSQRTFGETLTVAVQSQTFLPSLFFLVLMTTSPASFSTFQSFSSAASSKAYSKAELTA